MGNELILGCFRLGRHFRSGRMEHDGKSIIWNVVEWVTYIVSESRDFCRLWMHFHKLANIHFAATLTKNYPHIIIDARTAQQKKTHICHWWNGYLDHLRCHLKSNGYSKRMPVQPHTCLQQHRSWRTKESINAFQINTFPRPTEWSSFFIFCCSLHPYG